ncbi:MAG: hypothetical protein ABI317_05725 [Gaiellales bacterium]
MAEIHSLFREEVVRTVEAWPELEFVAEVANGRNALVLIRELAPTAAVVDLRLRATSWPLACCS